MTVTLLLSGSGSAIGRCQRPTLWCLMNTMTLTLLTPLLFVTPQPRFEFPEGVPLNAAGVTWYTPTDHYQIKGRGVYSRKESDRNANMEFPWKTGGMDRSTNGGSFLFHRIPAGEPIAWHAEGDKGGTYDGYIVWKYPEGTIFGEVLTVDGRCFEVRVMIRLAVAWDFKVYRPYASREDLGLPRARQYEVIRLRNKHSVRVIDEINLVDYTNLSRESVLAILGKPFREVTGTVWAESSGHVAYAPCADRPGQLVPMGYEGCHFGKDTCLKCHATAGRDARAFDRDRAWDGNIRGSDGVFSFSVFDQTMKGGAPKFRSDLSLRKE